MNSTNEDIQIYGKLVNVSTEGIVADAASIWCERYKKTVEDVIKDVNDKVEDSIDNSNDKITEINKNIENAVSRIDGELAKKADADKYLSLAGGTMDGGIISPSYKKVGGTGEQILLADGSIATTINTDTLNSILN